MDSSVYEKMNELQKFRDSNDVFFGGTIELEELDPDTNSMVKNAYDIYISMEDGPQGPVFKFYNKDMELLAINLNDGRGTIPSSNFADKLPPEIIKQFDDFLESLEFRQDNSLNKINSDLEKMSEVLGIPKGRIVAVSEAPNKKNNLEDKKKDDEKIHIKDEDELKKEDKTKKQKSPEEEKKLEALEKQQTSLSQKVNDRYTLGDILGVPNDGTLVAVYSDSIENGKQQNHTKFSFLIKDKEGNYTECPNIEQVGGITPDAKVAASSSKGDEVKTDQVNSLYKIKSSSNIEYMLTAKIGSQGTIDLGIGQRDRTQGVNSNELVTVTTPLKTTSNYYTTPETREALNGTHEGNKQATRRAQEGKAHQDENCKPTKDEFDGEIDTGHTHDEENENPNAPEITNNELEKIAIEILEESDKISNIYNRNDVINHLKQLLNEQNNISKTDLKNQVKTTMEENADSEHDGFPSNYPNLNF